jgi:ABC-type spermidine/putrescine transport system permease subunit II
MNITDITNNIDPTIAAIVCVNIILIGAIIITIKKIIAKDQKEQEQLKSDVKYDKESR